MRRWARQTFDMGQHTRGIRERRHRPRGLRLAAVALSLLTLLLLGGTAAPAQAQTGIVVGKLYKAASYSGEELSLVAGSIVDLVGTSWDNQAASIWVQSGTTIALYSDRNLTGVCEAFTASDSYLGNNPIRYRSVTSFHVGASCWAPVTRLYEHANYTGESRVVNALDSGTGADLRRIGFDDKVTSLRVPPGQKVAVWEHPDFTGHCELFTASDADLRNNRIGNDSITSAKFGADCPVVLYTDTNFGGVQKAIPPGFDGAGDFYIYPGLRNYGDAFSSIRVPAGMSIAVYQDAYYRGVCETISADDGDLRDNLVGNDTISSFHLGSCG